MKSVIRSIKPYWLYLIIIGKKTIEISKDCPKSSEWDSVVYFYCSKDKKSFNRIPEKDRTWMRKYLGKVACRFICDWIYEYESEFSKRNDVCQAIYAVDYDEDDGERNVCFMVSEPDDNRLLRAACLTWNEIKEYLGYKAFRPFYGWRIMELKTYDKPKELGEFFTVCHKLDCDQCGDCPHLCVARGSYPCDDDIDTWCGVDNCMPLTRPPQSWRYVEELSE